MLKCFDWSLQPQACLTTSIRVMSVQLHSSSDGSARLAAALKADMCLPPPRGPITQKTASTDLGGYYPLHLAARYCTSPEVVRGLVHACPDALEAKSHLSDVIRQQIPLGFQAGQRLLVSFSYGGKMAVSVREKSLDEKDFSVSTTTQDRSGLRPSQHPAWRLHRLQDYKIKGELVAAKSEKRSEVSTTTSSGTTATEENSRLYGSLRFGFAVASALEWRPLGSRTPPNGIELLGAPRELCSALSAGRLSFSAYAHVPAR